MEMKSRQVCETFSGLSTFYLIPGSHDFKNSFLIYFFKLMLRLEMVTFSEIQDYMYGLNIFRDLGLYVWSQGTPFALCSRYIESCEKLGNFDVGFQKIFFHLIAFQFLMINTI